MSTLLGSTSALPNDRYQGYPHDVKIAVPMTMPAGGPWLIQSVGSILAGDTTHFSHIPSVYMSVWDSGGNLLKYAAGFNPTGHAYGTQDSYTKTLAGGPLQVNGGTTLWVGFQWTTASDDGLQWNADYGATNYSSPNHTVPDDLTSKYNETLGKPQVWLYYDPSNPNVYVRRGGVWVKNAGLYVRRGGVWVQQNQGDVVVRRGSAWQNPT